MFSKQNSENLDRFENLIDKITTVQESLFKSKEDITIETEKAINRAFFKLKKSLYGMSVS